MTTLIPVLGDQLSHGLAALQGGPASGIVVMMEVADEARYVRHHPKKIALILSAMRHFASELRDLGWTVDYVRLDDPDNSGSFTGEIVRAAARHGATSIRVTEAGEWRVQTMLDGWPAAHRTARRGSVRRPIPLQSQGLHRMGGRPQTTDHGGLSTARCASESGC